MSKVKTIYNERYQVANRWILMIAHLRSNDLFNAILHNNNDEWFKAEKFSAKYPGTQGFSAGVISSMFGISLYR